MYGNRIYNTKNTKNSTIPNNPIQSFNPEYLQNVNISSTNKNDILSSNIAKFNLNSKLEINESKT